MTDLSEPQIDVLVAVLQADGRRWRPHSTQRTPARKLERKGLLYFGGEDGTGRQTYKLTEAGKALLLLNQQKPETREQ